jgi:hypothetical protein
MTRIKTPLLSLCALALIAVPTVAGPLATVPGAYFDGFTTWRGSSVIQGYYDYPDTDFPSDLTGSVDWAVFAPGDWPSDVGEFTDYTPTPGSFTYAYQINITGAAPLTQNITVVVNYADNLGTFTGDAGSGTVNGLTPFTAVLVPFDSVYWTWDPGIGAGESSIGLVFSSPHQPDFSFSLQIDDGSVGDAMVPAPLGPIIPEPGTLALASLGIGTAGIYWLRRRTRRTK